MKAENFRVPCFCFTSTVYDRIFVFIQMGDFKRYKRLFCSHTNRLVRLAFLWEMLYASFNTKYEIKDGKVSMKYDLIALDLDGTTLNPQNTVSPAVKQAAAWAREQGVRIVISTGRIASEAAEFAEMLGTSDDLVSAGGATLYSLAQRTYTMRISIPWEPAVRAAAVVERIGMVSMVYAGERMLITPYDEMYFSRYKTNEGFHTNKKVVPSVAEYIADTHLSVDKMFCRSKDPFMLANAREQIRQIPGVRVMSSADDNIEVISPIADKGRALERLCQQYGISLDRCIAIGDSENDLEMLQVVGMPVAMGNANDTVKAIAKYITTSNAEDGVAKAIYHLLGKEA